MHSHPSIHGAFDTILCRHRFSVKRAYNLFVEGGSIRVNGVIGGVMEG